MKKRGNVDRLDAVLRLPQRSAWSDRRPGSARRRGCRSGFSVAMLREAWPFGSSRRHASSGKSHARFSGMSGSRAFRGPTTTEALPRWPEYFDMWVFVHNAQGGLPPDVIAKLFELERSHAPTKAIPWGCCSGFAAFQSRNSPLFGDRRHVASTRAREAVKYLLAGGRYWKRCTLRGPCVPSGYGASRCGDDLAEVGLAIAG